MSLGPDDVKHIAHLAKLAMSDNTISALTNDLSNILNLVDAMNQVDTSEVQPLSHSFDATQPLRPDVVTEKNQRELFQQNAPQVNAGLYIVPQVIESE